MKTSILVIVAILLVVADYCCIKRHAMFPDYKKIVLKEIIPHGWKQRVCYLVIATSFLIVVLMLDLFYQVDVIYILKRIFLLAIMWPIAICDYKEMRIPNRFILCGVITRVMLLVAEFIVSVDMALAMLIYEGIAVVGVFVLCMLCAVISKGSLGMGDVKLLMLMALFLGIEGICYSLFVSLVFSFVIASGLLIFKKKSRSDVIPFAPFILAGTCVSIILSGV